MTTALAMFFLGCTFMVALVSYIERRIKPIPGPEPDLIRSPIGDLSPDCEPWIDDCGGIWVGPLVGEDGPVFAEMRMLENGTLVFESAERLPVGSERLPSERFRKILDDYQLGQDCR